MAKKKVSIAPTSLKFLVQDIPQEGFHLNYDVGQDDLELTRDEGRIVDPLHLDCDICHSPEGVCVKGTLSGTIFRECVRCLGEYQELIVLPCLGLFQGEQTKIESTTVVLDEESSDIGFEQIEEIYPCQDDQVELDIMLREQCILGTPIQRLCQSDCRGLCQHCGTNLNQSSCACADTVHFSPMVSALQQLKKNL
ncbi:YceD family protein [Nitrospira sp. M1]